MKQITRLLNLPQNSSFFLFGPRQVGKSTLLLNSFSQSKTLYYNLLDLEEFSILSSDPALLKNQVKARSNFITHVVIDEIQKFPALLDQVHSLIEQYKNIHFILSGSSARKLKKEGTNLLGGRAWTLSMFPLTHQELKDDFDLYTALSYGTLPAIYLNALAGNIEEASMRLRSYVETYLEEEIKSEALTRNLTGFIMFLRFAAQENGRILNFSNISRDIHVSANTVKSYFQIIQDTLLGFLLMPYSKSMRRKLVKHPKFYFFDMGLVRTISKKLSVPLEKGSKDFGDLFEHFLIKEIMHLSKYRNNDYEFSFYRSESDAEVDLIIETPTQKVYAIEIKSSASPVAKDLRGLKSFQEICPQAELFCACTCTKEYMLNGIRIMPWQGIFSIIGLV